MLFDCLADPTRRRLLALLVREGELCVCELTAAVAAEQPKVSRHLGIIREAGLVTARREGAWVFYQTSRGLAPWADTLLAALAGGAVPQLKADGARLRRMANRPARHAA